MMTFVVYTSLLLNETTLWCLTWYLFVMSCCFLLCLCDVYVLSFCGISWFLFVVSCCVLLFLIWREQHGNDAISTLSFLLLPFPPIISTPLFPCCFLPIICCFLLCLCGVLPGLWLKIRLEIYPIISTQLYPSCCFMLCLCSVLPGLWLEIRLEIYPIISTLLYPSCCFMLCLWGVLPGLWLQIRLEMLSYHCVLLFHVVSCLVCGLKLDWKSIPSYPPCCIHSVTSTLSHPFVVSFHCILVVSCHIFVVSCCIFAVSCCIFVISCHIFVTSPWKQCCCLSNEIW